MNIGDIAGLHCLSQLEFLHIYDYSRKPINFLKFPCLRYCNLEYGRNRSSILKCESLVGLDLHHFSEQSLALLMPLQELNDLYLYQRGLRDISEIISFPVLKRLFLSRIRHPIDIARLADCNTLEAIGLRGIKGVLKLDEISQIPTLKALEIVDCGDIESLAPLARCSNLEMLNFTGKTNVKDGDLRPLLGLPNLKTAMFGDRKHYNMKRADLPVYYYGEGEYPL
ncbi:MAG: hypothetical protein P4L46_15235 [Fimbriimonas sp.]|nr:hypothetical protein [Fimbriimonas sp.]